jgi:large-conductance mechanosensitive channel
MTNNMAISDVNIDDMTTVVKGTSRKIFSDFQHFMFSNSVLVAATGFCVGIATKEVIEKLVNYMVLPIFQSLLKLSILHNLYHMALSYVSKGSLQFFLITTGEIVWSLFVWIVIIVMTFVLMEYVLNRRIMGMKTVIKEDDKVNFVKAKANANENIIMTKEDVKRMDKVEEVEKKAGKQLKKIEDKTLMAAQRNPDKSISVVKDTTDSIRPDLGIEHFFALPLEL